MKLGDQRAFPSLSVCYSGMTLREYYIGQVIASRTHELSFSNESCYKDTIKRAARFAIDLVDEVLAQLEKEPKVGS